MNEAMRKFFLLTLGVTLLGLTLAILRPSFFETLEGKFYDLHFVLRGGAPTSGQVSVVMIDEKSLETYGRWPWPRSLIASVFDRVAERGARVVVPDIFFAEPSRGDDAEENDRALENTLKEHSNILMGYFFLMTSEEVQDSAVDPKESENSFEYLLTSALPFTSSPAQHLIEPLAVQGTLSQFTNLPGGARHGYFNLMHDPDGTVRSTPLAMKYWGQVFPSITLQSILYSQGAKGEDYFSRLPLNDKGELLVNYRGGGRVFTRVSVDDLMDISSESTLPSFQDKVVVVGAIAAGLEDARPTPLDAKMPSAILATNIIDNLIQGDTLRKDRMTDILSYGVLVLTGLILGMSLSRMKAVPGFLLFLGFLIGEAALNHYFFIRHRWVLLNVYPVASTFLIYAGVSLYVFLVQEKEKHFITETFGRYLSPDVIRELTENPDKIRLGGERKELTVFFSDIRDFATIVESTPPEILVDLLNSYLTPATDVIFHHKGLLDKYIGDAVMAVFGTPLPEPEHPRLACQAAVDTIRMVRAMQSTWHEEFHVPEIRIGVGVNTGLMTVGNMGSEARFDYTVMGDAVNLASRIEGLNKFYGTSILVSQHTYEKAREGFPFREVDVVQVKGKKETLAIYEIPVDPDDSFIRMAAIFTQALGFYREGRFQEARKLFEQCLTWVPDDGPSRLFVERCRQFEVEKPESWDGVTTFLRK